MSQSMLIYDNDDTQFFCFIANPNPYVEFDALVTMRACPVARKKLSKRLGKHTMHKQL